MDLGERESSVCNKVCAVLTERTLNEFVSHTSQNGGHSLRMEGADVQ